MLASPMSPTARTSNGNKTLTWVLHGDRTSFSVPIGPQDVPMGPQDAPGGLHLFPLSPDGSSDAVEVDSYPSFTVSIATKVEVCATCGSAEIRSPSTRR